MTLFLGIGLSLMWVKYKIGYPTNLFFYFLKFKGPAKKHVACPLHDLNFKEDKQSINSFIHVIRCTLIDQE